jgi:CheY-like chemotaxis protein
MSEQSQKVILVVEDELADQFSILRAFRQLQTEFSLQVVETGEEAIHYLQGNGMEHGTQYPPPVLIILDLKLPGMSGLDLLKWIRQQPQFQDLPVIALTAYGNRDLPRAYDLGLNFYLLKPVDSNSLAEVLQGLGVY